SCCSYDRVMYFRFMFVFVGVSLFLLCIFFFFQAEDGIRDATVTGVQTCALPISYSLVPLQHRHQRVRADADGGQVSIARRLQERSEERRVGKEGRCRWWKWNERKKREE